MARNYAAFPHDYLVEMEELSDAEFGRLARALLQYSLTGEPVTLGGNEKYFARRIMMQEDKFKASYEDSLSKRQEAGRKGAARKWDSNAISNDGKNSNAISNDGKNSNAILHDGKDGYIETEIEIETEIKTKPSKDGKSISRKRFTPPTLEAVVAYCESRSSTVDPKQFWEYYEAGNWADKDGKPVRSWKQKLLTWEHRETQKNEPTVYVRKSDPYAALLQSGVFAND